MALSKGRSLGLLSKALQSVRRSSSHGSNFTAHRTLSTSGTLLLPLGVCSWLYSLGLAFFMKIWIFYIKANLIRWKKRILMLFSWTRGRVGVGFWNEEHLMLDHWNRKNWAWELCFQFIIVDENDCGFLCVFFLFVWMICRISEPDKFIICQGTGPCFLHIMSYRTSFS